MIKRIEYVILAILLLVVGAFSFNWALKGAIHYQKDVLVPDIVNKPLIDALTILSEQNLGIKKEGAEFNDSVPAGTVLRQQPPAGMMVREGKVVRVTLSQGGETVFVPELIGQSLRSAEISLRYTLLSLGEVRSQPSMKYEKDIVISQNPAPKAVTPKNSLVHLVISQGPPADGTMLAPDFLGRPWSEVQAWSQQTGIKVEMKEDNSSPESEKVLEQQTPPDSPIQPGSTIKFVVASKKSESAAQSEASRSAKFHFEVPQSETAKQFSFVLLDDGASREIWRGSPEPGSKLDIPLPAKVNPGARVRIFVNGILTEERSL